MAATPKAQCAAPGSVTIKKPPPPSRRWHPGPALFLVEALHPVELFERLWPEVFLVHDASVAHDEALHARQLVACGCGDQREPADHRTLNHEVELSEWRRCALPLQDLEIVS